MKVYITITGTYFYHGHDFIEKGMMLRLEKEKDCKVDNESVAVLLDGIGKIGNVANSVRTVVGQSYSAGRLYDKIGDTAMAEVVYILPEAVLCTIEIETT